MTVPSPLVGASDRPNDDEISLAEFIQKGRDWAQGLWEERRFLGSIVAASAAIGLVLRLLSPEEFTASTKILPYGSAGNSGLSGLAGLAGIRLTGGSSDRTITPDLYPDMAKTLDFRIAVAETPIRFSTLPEPVTPLTYFREIAKPTPLEQIEKYTLGLPGLAWRAIRSGSRPQEEVITEEGRSSKIVMVDSAPSTIANYDGPYRTAVTEVGSRITVSAERLIVISATMPDRYAAADLVRVASERLMATVI